MADARIMIVEDEAIVAMEIRERLRDLGYEVPAVEPSGRGALDRVEELRPDLVLMDIRLRGEIDGIQAAGQIKAHYDIPVIFLTAYADDATLQRAKLTEPFGYILKPFQERELQTNIEMALYKHDMERKLKESRRWFNATLVSIGDGVVATDRSGVIRFMNPPAEELTGWTQDEAVGRDFDEVVRIEDEEFDSQGETPARMAIRTDTVISLGAESRLVSRNGREADIDAKFAPIKDDRGRIDGMVSVIHDITRRKNAEVAVRNSEKLYRALARSLPNGFVLLFDTDLCCRVFEGSALEAIGRPPGPVEGTPVQDVVPPGTAAPLAAACAAALEGRKSGLEVRIADHDYVVSVVPVRDPDGQIFAGTLLAFDITEHKKLERQVLEISDTERRQISSDLHDGLGQNLTGIALMVQALQERLTAQSSPEAATAAAIEDLVTQAITQTQRLVRGLCPVDVESNGIVFALEQLTAKVNNLFDIRCVLESSRGVTIENNAAATHLYRIAQEAVNNVLKYAQAKHLLVRLGSGDGAVTLTVEDDGIGIPEAERRRGMGMSIMQYRARMINGSLDIRHAPRGGTIVSCSFRPQVGETESERSRPNGNTGNKAEKRENPYC